MESSLTTAEIIKIFPESIRFLDKIEHAKQILTDYEHPFDGYRSTEHSVLVFEEFRSSLRIQDMLNYLDGYPCELKARYRTEPLPAKAGRFNMLLKQPKVVHATSYRYLITFILSQSYQNCSSLADLDS